MRDVSTILVEPFFTASAHVPRTLAKNIAFGFAVDINTPLEIHRAQFAHLFAVFDRIAELGAVRVSLIDDLCQGGLCRSTYEGRPVFSDNNHIADAMSGMLSEVFEREMPALR